MELTVHIPDEVAPSLRAADGDLSRRALEALAIQEYKNGHITKVELRQMLGFATRWQVDGFLKAHEVYDGYSEAEILEQVATLKRLGF